MASILIASWASSGRKRRLYVSFVTYNYCINVSGYPQTRKHPARWSLGNPPNQLHCLTWIGASPDSVISQHPTWPDSCRHRSRCHAYRNLRCYIDYCIHNACHLTVVVMWCTPEALNSVMRSSAYHEYTGTLALAQAVSLQSSTSSCLLIAWFSILDVFCCLLV